MLSPPPLAAVISPGKPAGLRNLKARVYGRHKCDAVDSGYALCRPDMCRGSDWFSCTSEEFRHIRGFTPRYESAAHTGSIFRSLTLADCPQMGIWRKVRLTNDPSPPKASPWQATYEFNVRCAARRWFQLTLSVLHRSSCEHRERNSAPCPSYI